VRWRGPGPIGALVLVASMPLAKAVWPPNAAAVVPQAATGSAPMVAQTVRQLPPPDGAPFAGEMRSSGPGARARTGSRKAVPITRGQELGLRFRPDERDPYAGAPAFPAEPNRQPTFGADDPQFRPVQKRRKPTYEELQAEQAASQSPVQPPPQYGPGLPPTLPLPPIGGFR
jgi:hypothetical protein